MNGSPVTPEPTVNSNATHTFIYFKYDYSTDILEIKRTQVIPDFAGWLFIPFIMGATLLAFGLKKKMKKLS